jgi:hypothetical protein
MEAVDLGDRAERYSRRMTQPCRGCGGTQYQRISLATRYRWLRLLGIPLRAYRCADCKHEAITRISER